MVQIFCQINAKGVPEILYSITEGFIRGYTRVKMLNTDVAASTLKATTTCGRMVVRHANDLTLRFRNVSRITNLNPMRFGVSEFCKKASRRIPSKGSRATKCNAMSPNDLRWLPPLDHVR